MPTPTHPSISSLVIPHHSEHSSSNHSPEVRKLDSRTLPTNGLTRVHRKRRTAAEITTHFSMSPSRDRRSRPQEARFQLDQSSCTDITTLGTISNHLRETPHETTSNPPRTSLPSRESANSWKHIRNTSARNAHSRGFSVFPLTMCLETGSYPPRIAPKSGAWGSCSPTSVRPSPARTPHEYATQTHEALTTQKLTT